MSRIRNGQWVKFDEPEVTVNGETAILGDIFPDVCYAGDGKIVGIFTAQRLDVSGDVVPMQINPVDNSKGENLSVVNKLTSLPETMAFVSESSCKLAIEMKSQSIVAHWPPVESLTSLSPVESLDDLPAGRQQAEGYTPQA